MGSFFNVVILRYDPKQSFFNLDHLTGRSKCVHCHKQLKWYELFPVISFMALDFPLLVANLVAIGESTGKVDKLLEKISDFYTRQVDETAANLVELIQPILMVVIAVFVGILFASILMPIYNLAQAF